MNDENRALYQTILWEKVREKLDARHQLAEEIAEILSCSRDSAYRRLRNETLLSFDETVALVKYYGISLP